MVKSSPLFLSSLLSSSSGNNSKESVQIKGCHDVLPNHDSSPKQDQVKDNAPPGHEAVVNRFVEDTDRSPRCFLFKQQRLVDGAFLYGVEPRGARPL
jgi:hypothetical protein